MPPVSVLNLTSSFSKRAVSGSFSDGADQSSQGVNVVPILGGAIGGLITVGILGYCIIFLWMRRMARPASAHAGGGLRGWVGGLGTASVPGSEGSTGSDTVCSGGEKGAFDVPPSPSILRNSTSSAPVSILFPPHSARSENTQRSLSPTTPNTARSMYPAQSRVPVPGVTASSPVIEPISPPPKALVNPAPSAPARRTIIPHRPLSERSNNRRVSWLTDLTNSTMPEEKKVKKQKDAKMALRSYQREASASSLDV